MVEAWQRSMNFPVDDLHGRHRRTLLLCQNYTTRCFYKDRKSCLKIEVPRSFLQFWTVLNGHKSIQITTDLDSATDYLQNYVADWHVIDDLNISIGQERPNKCQEGSQEWEKRMKKISLWHVFD